MKILKSISLPQYFVDKEEEGGENAKPDNMLTVRMVDEDTITLYLNIIICVTKHLFSFWGKFEENNLFYGSHYFIEYPTQFFLTFNC